MILIHVQVTSEVSATETKNMERTNMGMYINASQIVNILYL